MTIFLSFSLFNKYLFFLGGVPRFCILFAMDAKVRFSSMLPSSNPRAEIEASFQNILDSNLMDIWKSLPDKDLVLLCAHAVSGETVDAAKEVSFQNTKWPWSRIRDTGFCDIVSGRVIVPYIVFYLLARKSVRIDLAVSPEQRCFQQALLLMNLDVDAVLFSTPPWLLWEKFGAYYHALRINALLIVGTSEGKFSQLIAPGAISNDCDDMVELRPMQVIQASQPLSRNTEPCVYSNSSRCNWIEGDGGVGYIVLNSESGRGVDIWFTLKLLDPQRPNQYLLVLDQRKRVAEVDANATQASFYESKARDPKVVPTHQKITKTVVGIFSMLSSVNAQQARLPVNTFVVSYPQLSEYHGQLSDHPAASPFIRIRFDNLSTLKLLDVVTDTRTRKLNDTEASCIIQNQFRARWQNVDEVITALKSSGHSIESFVDSDRIRFD
jgi:hypothetical protein